MLIFLRSGFSRIAVTRTDGRKVTAEMTTSEKLFSR
jgi:hypothetical protein